MALTIATQFEHWFRYEAESTRLLIEDLRALPAGLKARAEYQTMLDLVGHLVAARQMWLWRFGAEGASRPAEVFPKGVAIEDADRQFEETAAMWRAYLARLDEAEVGREFRYQSVDGGRWQNTIHDALIQLHGHSAQHRAQIAMVLRGMGVAPRPVDFVYWSRRPAVE